MLKNLREKKKKKGFTLIELVIVLAVLAIIALIAIPNFNKVRTDSQKKADDATCDVIERVTTMAIANEDLKVGTTGGTRASSTNGTITITVGDDGTTIADTNIIWKDDATRAESNPTGKANFIASLDEVKAPQQKNGTGYTVTIDANDKVLSVEVDGI
ncbi:MAG: prepilin-type N-terminal cleavage/methylation domain-containing protein [Sarcina sp.]